MKITMKKYCKKDYGEWWVQYLEMCAAWLNRSDVTINQIQSKANPHTVMFLWCLAYIAWGYVCKLLKNVKNILFASLVTCTDQDQADSSHHSLITS